MTKIKVVQFVGSMNCGGTETMLMNLFRDFDHEQYNFIFMENVYEKSWYTDEILSLGGTVKKVSPFRLIKIRKYIKELIQFFKNEKIDVVHSHVFLHSGIVLYAAKKAGVKIRIAHSHSAMNANDNNRFKFLILQNLILKNATKLVACSTEAGLCLFGKEFKKKGIVLPNPIQLDKIKNVEKSNIEKIKKKYSLTNDILVIGHVGRLVEVKNHKFLIELAKLLKDKKINFKMFFLGEGVMRERIEKQIKELKLEDYVILTGNVSNVYDFMKIFDLLLLPSFYEGLPVTLIEAQASNLQCLVSSNISRESDLGLGLIKFLDIKKIEYWVNEIIHFKKKNCLPKDLIYDRIKERRYDSNITKLEYEKLYRQK